MATTEALNQAGDPSQSGAHSGGVGGLGRWQRLREGTRPPPHELSSGTQVAGNVLMVSPMEAHFQLL